MWDPLAGVGGMNHFLLPGDEGEASDHVKYGVNAMELLINGLLQKGAARAACRRSCSAAPRSIQTLSDVGAKNAEFAHKFLRLENIPCVGQSLGGERARRVRFWPTTGRAGQLLLDPTQTDVAEVERARPHAAAFGGGRVGRTVLSASHEPSKALALLGDAGAADGGA